MTATSAIVVGVDDSPGSLAALRAAATEAALRGIGLRVIHVWHFPSTWGVPLSWPAGSNPGQFVEQRLNDEVNELQAARAAAAEPPVKITVEVIQGDAEAELRAAAEGSPMLVLGARSHHGPSAILGSVSHACAARPTSPVLIVPAATSDEAV
jgi:nucleotide-binding universal stress UspA family protein